MSTDEPDQAQQVLMSNADAAKRGALTIWTVYDRPKDHPDGFIARRFEIDRGQTIATARHAGRQPRGNPRGVLRAGLTKLSRQAGDEPKIIESWV